MPKPRTIDEYLAGVRADQYGALVKLRNAVHEILPNATECISYSMPAFRYDGQVVAGFLATKNGCSYFPFSGRTLATLAADLARFDQTKSALHFDPKRPLPKTLVRKLLRARIAEITRKDPKPDAARSRQRSTPSKSRR